MLHPAEYPEFVRDRMRRRLDDAEPLPEDADWALLNRAERKIAKALWIAEGAGPYAAVDAFSRTHPDLAKAIDDVLLPAFYGTS